MDPFSIFSTIAGGALGGKPLNSDAGSYAPVISGATTGNFYLGEGSGTAATPQIPMELIAIGALFAWLMFSKR